MRRRCAAVPTLLERTLAEGRATRATPRALRVAMLNLAAIPPNVASWAVPSFIVHVVQPFVQLVQKLASSIHGVILQHCNQIQQADVYACCLAPCSPSPNAL